MKAKVNQKGKALSVSDQGVRLFRGGLFHFMVDPTEWKAVRFPYSEQEAILYA